ncbi:MAG: hypothetical protein KF901_10010 [Myxococcales bacterium]|nr:hypothetical protein [Myxococcales bacterium]
MLALSLVVVMAAPSAASPRLALHLDAVRLDASADAGQLVVADARWVNRTGGHLEAVTNFSGVFDGLALVILDESGRELRRIHYTHHQSPYAEDRRVLLPPGTTRRSIGFPIFDPNLPSGRYLVRLEGELAGHPRHRGMRTRTRALRVR